MKAKGIARLGELRDGLRPLCRREAKRAGLPPGVRGRPHLALGHLVEEVERREVAGLEQRGEGRPAGGDVDEQPACSASGASSQEGRERKEWGGGSPPKDHTSHGLPYRSCRSTSGAM